MKYKDYCEYYDRPTDKVRCSLCSVYPDTQEHPCPHKGGIADVEEHSDVVLTNFTDDGANIQFRINGRGLSDFFVAKEQLNELYVSLTDYWSRQNSHPATFVNDFKKCMEE